MEILSLIFGLIFRMGVTFGVGSSTFALTNFIVALRDGVIDEGEKRLMHVVYFVLRIGMVMIAIGLIAPLFVFGLDILSTQYLMVLTLLAIITVNAVLMTKRIMPMKYGPVLAGGSWYSIFLVTELPVQGLSYPVLLMYYAVFLVIFYLGFELVKKTFLPPKPTA